MSERSKTPASRMATFRLTDEDRYLPEGTPCQWCGAPLATKPERNASVCDACFAELDRRATTVIERQYAALKLCICHHGYSEHGRVFDDSAHVYPNACQHADCVCSGYTQDA